MAAAAAAAAAPAPLPPWMGDPRITVIQVEVFVAGAAILLFFQLIFGFYRRQSSNMLVQGGVWVAYTLSFPLVTYTLGLMQSSPAKSPMYPVWAISLYLVAGCTNSITAYDLDENKQWKKHLFELLQLFLYAGLIFLLLTPTSNKFYYSSSEVYPIYMCCYFLLVIIMYTNLLRVAACWMANFSDPSKAVGDYMRDHPTGDQTGYNPVRMKGYKYLVRWHGYSLSTEDAKVPNYRNKLAEDIITIDKIWEGCNDMLFQDSNGGSQLNDCCLSFALFHLLKRRFFGINCYEAARPETRNFVLKGLLSENGDDYARAFRVIEVELGFFHDFFFTKYASIFENEILFFLAVIVKTILTAVLGVLVSRNSFTLMTRTPIVPVNTRNTDTMITLVILGALIIVDILQTMLYLASDWAMVSLACYHLGSRSCQAFLYSLLRKPIWLLRKLSLFKYWQNEIGQYSVIECCGLHKSPLQLQEPQNRINTLCNFVTWQVQVLFHEVFWKIWTCQYCRSIVHSVKLPDSVKREIVSSLRSTGDGDLTNGEASLRRHGVHAQFLWTLKREDWNLTDTMLIWHIATNYCEIALPPVEGDQQEGYHEVATKISKYSAYLMAFHPELLPGSYADTKFTFDKVMDEAATALHPGPLGHELRTVVDRDMLAEVIDRPREGDENGTIFFKGLALGRELEGMQGQVPIWKLMAEFWAEIILYVTPSNNVRGHTEQLANGGEFLTHLWALLSHAGILTRPKQQDYQGDV